MKIREIIGALEDFAPLALQESYDNAGLQIGLAEDVDATGVLLCLDVTEKVVDEAISRGCNMIVCHHPLLFRPLKSISGKDYIERIVIKAIKNDVVIYAAHTNLDNAPDGVSHKMAEKLGLVNLTWLDMNAGADGGSGVVGELPVAMEREDFIRRVKEVYKADNIRYNDWTGKTVRKVAVCGGAGAFLMANAARANADAFITGEIGYHRFFGHEEDLLLMEIGHYESEQYTLEIFHRIIGRVAPELKILDTEVVTNPVRG